MTPHFTMQALPNDSTCEMTIDGKKAHQFVTDLINDAFDVCRHAAMQAHEDNVDADALTGTEIIGILLMGGVPVRFEDGKFVSPPCKILRIDGRYHVYYREEKR